MRTQKRFTPDLLDRYKRIGRGQGQYETYIPWHRVGRGDPASRGRSHLQMWHGRQRELLSDKEWIYFLFSTMVPNIDDIREQFPLHHENTSHEPSAYALNRPAPICPGTLEIAKRMGIKHPKVHGNGRTAEWVMTTDLLLSLKRPAGKLELLAVAIKLNGEVDKKRTRELLAIERHYWLERDVQWLLVTPSMYDSLLSDALRNCMPWSLGAQADKTMIDFVVASQKEWEGHSVTYVLKKLAAICGGDDLAQRAFWQSAWSGRLPIDLRRGWRPHQPFILLSESAFWDLNPIASRRSAWA